MSTPVFRGNQSLDTQVKEPQITRKERNRRRVVKEWKKRADSKNIENNYQYVGNRRNAWRLENDDGMSHTQKEI